MHVITGGDVRNSVTDVLSILQYRVAARNIFKSELVAQRDRVVYRDVDRSVRVHDPAGKRLPGGHAFNDHDADRVALIVDEKIRGCVTQSGFLTRQVMKIGN